jgi:hypothetical protein
MNIRIKDCYKKGYNTLPNLNKIGEEEVFEKETQDCFAIQLEKKEALANQNVFFEYNNNPKHYEISENWIVKNYPRKLKSTNFLEIAKETEEDFLIHKIDNEKDYLSSAHVCFASHWRPEDKIGKSFEEIHQPVPMNLKNSKKLVYAMIHGGIFERFVWSVVYEKKYNFHPRFESKKFNPENPEVYIKVERQITVGFSEHNFCLFILRQYLIEDIDKSILANVIENMSPEQKKYKGLNNSKELLFFLRNKT